MDYSSKIYPSKVSHKHHPMYVIWHTCSSISLHQIYTHIAHTIHLESMSNRFDFKWFLTPDARSSCCYMKRLCPNFNILLLWRSEHLPTLGGQSIETDIQKLEGCHWNTTAVRWVKGNLAIWALHDPFPALLCLASGSTLRYILIFEPTPMCCQFWGSNSFSWIYIAMRMEYSTWVTTPYAHSAQTTQASVKARY